MTKKSTNREDVRLLFSVLNNPNETEAARDWLWDSISDITSVAPSLDYVNDKRIFTRAVSEVLTNIEENGATRRDSTYQELKMIVRRISQGESLTSIYKEDKEKRARKEEEYRNAPEPKNWLSPEWRYWKTRKLTEGFNSGDIEIYGAAWKEFQALLNELVKREDFYHISNALALLPHLIIARQDIARLIPSYPKDRRKPAYFKKGGARS